MNLDWKTDKAHFMLSWCTVMEGCHSWWGWWSSVGGARARRAAWWPPYTFLFFTTNLYYIISSASTRRWADHFAGQTVKRGCSLGQALYVCPILRTMTGHQLLSQPGWQTSDVSFFYVRWMTIKTPSLTSPIYVLFSTSWIHQLFRDRMLNRGSQY